MRIQFYVRTCSSVLPTAFPRLRSPDSTLLNSGVSSLNAVDELAVTQLFPKLKTFPHDLYMSAVVFGLDADSDWLGYIFLVCQLRWLRLGGRDCDDGSKTRDD